MEGVRRFGGRLPGNACRCDAAVLRCPQVSPQGRPHLPPRPPDGQHGPQHRPELPYEDPGLVAKVITFFRRLGEFVRLTVIFPENAVGFWARYVGRRVKAGW